MAHGCQFAGTRLYLLSHAADGNRATSETLGMGLSSRQGAKRPSFKNAATCLATSAEYTMPVWLTWTRR